MFSRGSRAAHKQSGQVFSNAAVLNSSWFNKLMLLFSEWQPGYLSIIILRDSPSQMLDSAFDSTGTADLAGGKEGNRNELLQQAWGRDLPSLRGHQWIATTLYLCTTDGSLPVEHMPLLRKFCPHVPIKHHFSYLCGCCNLHRGGVRRSAAEECRLICWWDLQGKKLTPCFCYHWNKWNGKS